ncbi:MAG: inosine-5-monophosphate dehydrogenase [Parvibaculum sp.]|uniref:CBS domain-containing protein n=1 Tax=Parvibaculum sp. TaxID=2024848 RepID=UPI000C616A93|nr:CBS domain-containing protein [Parvibaculum sp.]MAU60849.1 inosine-5-monophosphate dehydrogenase [Parvibaculum sp.]HAC58421.1 CBS domain-containing protein [Rhodobiaceae bacterium]
MRVSEAMHKSVAWVSPQTKVPEIAKIMKEHDIGAVPVGENDRLIGMVTDRDIAIRALPNGHDAAAMTARDVMTSGISYCHTDDSLENAIKLMESKKVRRLPVIDKDKRMVGMLSLGDISHCANGTQTGELAKAVSGHHA